jgi:hypothetical protein
LNIGCIDVGAGTWEPGEQKRLIFSRRRSKPARIKFKSAREELITLNQPVLCSIHRSNAAGGKQRWEATWRQTLLCGAKTIRTEPSSRSINGQMFQGPRESFAEAVVSQFALKAEATGQQAQGRPAIFGIYTDIATGTGFYKRGFDGASHNEVRAPAATPRNPTTLRVQS